MVDVVSLFNAEQHPGVLLAQHRLRHKVFVERLGWSLPTINGLEYDEYDGPAATYLVKQDEAGEARAVARLVPTNQPYMLEQVWPDLLGGDIPKSPQIWEGTRFGVDHTLPASERRRLAMELVVACLEFGLAHGVRGYVVLMPVFFVRGTLGALGCDYRFRSRTDRFGRVEMGVADVDVTAESLARALMTSGLTGPVISHPETQEYAA